MLRLEDRKGGEFFAGALARHSLASAVKLSASAGDVSSGRSLHAHIVKSGLLNVTSIANHVLNMYCKCSCLRDAHLLFDEMPDRNVVSFSTLISASSRSGEPGLSLYLAKELQRAGLEPNEFVFSGAISSCSKLRWIFCGKQVHAQAVVSDLASNPFVKASLVDMYSKFGDLHSAVSSFRLGPAGDPAVVNSMVSGLVGSGLHYEALRLLRETWNSSDFRFTNYTFVSAIKACGDLPQGIGRHLHGLLVKCGCDSDCFVGTSLVDMYGRFGDADGMERALRCVTRPDLALQNAMIVGSAQNGLYGIALEHFMELRLGGFAPDECTLSSVLKACGGLRLINLGRIVHGLLEVSDLRHSLVVGTALIDMYLKCGEVEGGRSVFDRMQKRSAITYNTMIAGLGQNQRFEEATALFVHMNREGPGADLATFVAAIGSSPGHGWAIYARAAKCGLGRSSMVENVLLDSVLRDGEIKEALDFFHQMEDPDVVSWTTVISGLTQSGFYSEALELFRKMMMSTKISPNVFTFSSALKACGRLADLEQGRTVHACLLKHGPVGDGYTASSIMDMYASCGALEESRRVFRGLPEGDVVTWNTMIGSYASHGYGRKALELYERMVEEGVAPSHVTFISLLSACSRCGLVDEAVGLFERMAHDHGVNPRMEHYACMVDLFGRAGMLEKARGVIESMPFEPDSSIWTVFLASCRVHGRVELAGFARDHLLAMGDEDSRTHVLMYNVYSQAGNWADAEKSRMRVASGGVRKEPGISWVQTRDDHLQNMVIV